MDEVIYEVRHLKKHYITKKDFRGNVQKTVKACDDLSFDLRKGETLGVVGESGCGKSSLGRTMIRLQEPTDGSLIFQGVDITHQTTAQLRAVRSDIQMIFQDPYASLNPKYTILSYVREPLDVFKIGESSKRDEMAAQILAYVGIPEALLHRYPHELSGGQRQRVVIARAVVVQPKVVICDEPVSALDVSVRAQVLNLMKKIQREQGISYLFISHDISVIRYVADRVMVMYLGKIVEMGDKEDVLGNPLHPYTKSLFSAIPIPDVHVKRERIKLTGDVPSPVNPPSGCRFHTRCPFATPECAKEEQVLKDYGNGHMAACRCIDK